VLARPTQPALPDLHAGEVVLVAPPVLETLGLSLARLIERLEGSTVVAIGLSGAVDDRAIAVAKTAGITLFELPANADMRAIQRESERLLADPEAQYERRAAQLYAALTFGGLSDNGRLSLLKTVEQWTGHAVAFPAEPGMPTTLPVLLDGRRVGLLGSTGSHQWDLVALEQGTTALALLLDKERAIEATEDRLRGNILEALLTGITLDSAGIRRAAEQGIVFDIPHLIAAFRPSDGSQLERILAALRRTSERLRHPGLVAEYDGVALVVLRLSDAENPEQPLRDLHTALHEAGFALDGGFSVANDIADWPGAWAEALGSLRLGREMLGQGVLAGAAELGVYRLLLALGDNAQARAFYERTIGPLAAHDARQDGDLLHTLQMFFVYLGNHSQAAAALHIHRNTLLYRLGRIASITAHHLDRAPDRLALQIGLALHRIYQSQKSEARAQK
jgi:purine catabolism regulator